MLKRVAVIFGLLFTAIGILGFIPAFVQSGNLLGIFRVNFEHNIAHLGLGILGILCGVYSDYASKVYLIAAGVIYALLAVLGFTQNTDMLLGMIAINTADNWLHTFLALVAFYFAFRSK